MGTSNSATGMGTSRLIAAAIALVRTVWFHFRVLKDERGLTARFGEPYLDYMRRVNRWLPGLF